MNNRIVFFSKTFSNRLHYVIQLVLTDTLGLDVFFTSDPTIFINTTLPKINYNNEPISDVEFFIKSSHLLFEKKIEKQAFDANSWDSLDGLAKIFILVTRYEEYTADPSVLDAHGRFPAKASLNFELNFLRQPVVNQWIMNLKKELNEKYPSLEMTTPQYLFQPTYDIDQAWAFKNKGWLRNFGGFFKALLSLKWNETVERFLVVISYKNDPEHTFEYLEKLHKTHNLNPIFFWLLGDYSTYDKNIDWQNKNFQRLIRKIAAQYRVGIHPSYQSNSDFGALKNEIHRLETIVKDNAPPQYLGFKTTKISRQHYLKLTFPETYRNLIAAGISEDYTMGYADDIGFRAGIATPYFWYDLEQEQATNLKIHPFAFMEVTIKDYLRLSPEEALVQVRPLIEATKEVGGTLITLWHNSTLTDSKATDETGSNWAGWRRVYESILELAK